MIFSKILVCVSLLISLNAAFAQSPSSAFEVASIKPSDPKIQGITFRNGPGGSLNITGATLKMLIEQAYDVRDFQISGGPGWINSDRYDIVAKAESGVNPPPPNPANIPDQRKAMEQQRERLRALLADRFQLRIRRETKDMQVYALTQAKGGPKLKESNLEIPAPKQNGDKGPQTPRGAFMRMGPGQIIAQAGSMDFLIQALSRQLGRTVVDRTGLKGMYDFTLEWTPDPAQGMGQGFGGPSDGSVGKEPPRSDNPAPADPNGPSLFAALQEQLGLKLENQKGPVEVIVIESVERPSEN
jgi:bla regulator protein blaR1